MEISTELAQLRAQLAQERAEHEATKKALSEARDAHSEAETRASCAEFALADQQAELDRLRRSEKTEFHRAYAAEEELSRLRMAQ
ncbi:hypothetical protein [Acidovorax sp. FJL06]|uniref:hypothetical protein n=1 Tax=Acidovorax sp. FJL06 TaxID=2153365 RepID=UPI000F586861|nr:hypothetical protein [Acidovorax sp. FJL06]RQO80455.1 hypothetical protein DBV10_19310 [Acidovorax sp. FJL06]